MVTQAPLVTGSGLAAAVAAGCHWRKEGRTFLRWNSLFPELVLLVALVGAFLANPTPFPYNLLFLAPFFVVAGAAFWKAELADAQSIAGIALFTGLLVICHIFPFAQQTLRHFDRTNDRQTLIMNLAETMTDPVNDRVFDGTGLVPTRKTIGYRWQIHSLTIQDFYDGKTPSVRAMLAQNPASVFIPSYRTDWLPKEDKLFIKSHYFPLADDFWVLGSVLDSGGGPWTCMHGGRYQILMGCQAEGTPARSLQVDGQTMADRSALALTPGPHEIRSSPPGKILVVWLGPSLTEMPQVSPGDHRDLFVNWY
jgi:hypothetical protein